MKKALAYLTLLLCPFVLLGQQYTLTPHIGLQIPAFGSNNWSIPLQYDMNLLDTLLANGTGGGGSGIVWEGAWLNSSTYLTNQAVSYFGSSYVAIQSSTGQVPTNTTYWSPLALQGAAGAAGATGTAATITVGTVTTGTASVVNVGTSSAAIFNFTVPMGASGPAGAAGQAGATGAAGPTIYPGAGVAVSTGSAWTTSLAAPASAFVGVSDTQTLTNKSISYAQITGAPAVPFAGTNGIAFNTSTTVSRNAVAADFPTLNQNTTGNAATATLATNATNATNATTATTAAGVSGTVGVANGGTGSATAPANSLFGNFTSGVAAPGFSATPIFSAALLTGFPTLNQNTTGSAGSLSAASALPAGTTGTTQTAGDTSTKIATDQYVQTAVAAAGSFTYPPAGIPVSTGSAWGTSKTTPAGTIVGTTDTQTITNKSIDASEINTSALAIANGGTGSATAAANTLFGNFAGATGAPGFSSSPVFSAAGLTNFPTLNQSTTGNAATATVANNLTGTPTIPSGVLAVTQTAGDTSTALATDAFVQNAVANLLSAPANSVFGNFTGATATPAFSNAPIFSAANLTSFPTFNQNTTGTAANLSGTPALPNGVTATTQTAGDATAKVATDAFVLASVAAVNGGPIASIHQTGLTAAVATSTLCAASYCTAGQYNINVSLMQTGTPCSVVGTGTVNVSVTWTDTNGTSHTGIILFNQSSGTATSYVATGLNFSTSLASAFANGTFSVSTNGTLIQYQTTYTGCTTGTGTYQLDMQVLGSSSGGGGTGITTNPLTFNNAGTGAASGTTFNGTTSQTISYNSIGAAPIASPGLTGNPTAPTQAITNSSTAIATTAFVKSIAVGGGGGLNPQTGTTYTVVAADGQKLVTFSNTAAQAITLPVATTTGFTSGYEFHFKNINSGVVTITPTTSTIDGQTTLVLLPNEGVEVWSDGANYWIANRPTIYSTTAPTPSCNTGGAGTGCTVVLGPHSTNSSGQIQLTAGSGGGTNQVAVTLTFANGGFKNGNVYCQLSPASPRAALDALYLDGGTHTTSIQIYAASNSVANGVAYFWNYLCPE